MAALTALAVRAAPPDADVLAAVETALVTHRAFGDSNYIRDQLAVAYRRRLHKLGGALPEAESLATLLDAAPPARQRQLLGDTVLRCAVQHAMRQLQLGDEYGLPLPQCAALFRAAGEHLRADLPGGPLAAHLPPMARLHDEGSLQDQDTYIWHAWQEGTPYARAFLAVMEDNYGAPLATPTPQERALLRRGLRLLETLLPRLTASALSHVQLIALFPKLGTWRGKASSSQFRVNGSVFLNQELIGNPWWLAEHLLHESLHQKLYDFRHGHSLLAPDYARDDGARVCSLWNAPDDDGNHYWDAHRTLAAFHVYVHLALLCLLAEQQEAALAPQYGPIGQHMSGSGRAIDRARYLGEQLHSTTWPELGLAGRQMTHWLLDVLDALDTQRRPSGATLHLLLDLYERQSRKLDTYLTQQPPPRSDTLGLQAQQELAMTRQALHMLDRELPPSPPAQEHDWPQARQRVLQALWPLSEDETLMGNSGYPQAQALVVQMVQLSSRQLAALGALG
ncbi:hypothetical protein [Janthinobacterium sp. UMAB-60]|uniref:hypothetical protein n=1 Tax=Janthinobacterium sp. UMAB-60 TaxID=1365365 RepID=UPI001C599CE7|nr:hypothetical protein [Janthinobacterium sp. UMAB-60]